MWKSLKCWNAEENTKTNSSNRSHCSILLVHFFASVDSVLLCVESECIFWVFVYLQNVRQYFFPCCSLPSFAWNCDCRNVKTIHAVRININKFALGSKMSWNYSILLSLARRGYKYCWCIRQRFRFYFLCFGCGCGCRCVCVFNWKLCCRVKWHWYYTLTLTHCEVCCTLYEHEYCDTALERQRDV